MKTLKRICHGLTVSTLVAASACDAHANATFGGGPPNTGQTAASQDRGPITAGTETGAKPRAASAPGSSAFNASMAATTRHDGSLAGNSGAVAGSGGIETASSVSTPGATTAGAPAADAATSTARNGVTVAPKSAAIDAWWAYERAAKFEVESSQQSVPMRDGTRLACTLSRPASASEKQPGLVVELTPYVLQSDQYQAEASYFVKRGYVTLVCLVRGIGGSGDSWQHPFAPQDALDMHDLVEWLAQQPYCDGRIGVFGESYGGATTYGAAVERAPHLRAIAPMESPGTLYDDVNYPGGIEATAGGPMNFWPTIAELMSLGGISADEEYALYAAHPTYDEFWKERTFRGRHAQIQVPVLAFGGWTDNFFRSGMLTNIEPILDRTWAIYGQWVHTIPVDLGTCDSQCAQNPLPGGVLLAWFDHWVMELPDVPLPEAPVFMSLEGPEGQAAAWRELSGWTPSGSDQLRYELSADAALATNASTMEWITFHEPGEATQAGAALTFTTAPLEADRVLLGRATLALHASLSSSDANFYVELFDVDAQDAETFVNDGYLKASHRTSHTEPNAVTAGEELDYLIEVRPQHFRFKAGHRLRMRISGGPMDSLVQPSPVDVRVQTGRSHLDLPGSAAAL